MVDRKIFLRNPHLVAVDLLGSELIHVTDQGEISGIITEVEVYEAFTDKSAHSYTGKSKRNEALFLEGGHLYLFKVHKHICLDIVTEKEGVPSSVLIRSLEPLKGIERMKELRSQGNIKNLTTGPGKLTQALDIEIELNKLDLCSSDSPLKIRWKDVSEEEIYKTTRIGISRDTEKLNRYYIKNNEYIPRK